MKSIDLAQCKRDWNFSPQKPWPEALPSMAWRGQLLCGFEKSEGMAIDLDHVSLAEALRACYESLSLVELSLFSQLSGIDGEDRHALFAGFGFRDDRNCQRVCEALLHTPGDFQNWAARKELGVKDLAVLRALPAEIDIAPLCQIIADLSPSKSLGRQILELASELLLLGEELPAVSSSAECWQKELYRQRFQKMSEADGDRSEKLRNLPWPLHSRTQWLRQGDRTGVQFQFYATNQAELEKQWRGLEKVCQLTKEDPSLLWKN